MSISDSAEQKRTQLIHTYDELMQELSESSSSDNTDQLSRIKEFAEVLREELDNELQHNNDLWIEMNVQQTYNQHLNSTIENNHELIEQLNEITKNVAADDVKGSSTTG